MSRDYGDQYGEVGELDGSNHSSDLLSQSSEQLESPFAPPSSLDLDGRGKGGAVRGWILGASDFGFKGKEGCLKAVWEKRDDLVPRRGRFKVPLSFCVERT